MARERNNVVTETATDNLHLVLSAQLRAEVEIIQRELSLIGIKYVENKDLLDLVRSFRESAQKLLKK